jgi:hypothetical protein
MKLINFLSAISRAKTLVLDSLRAISLIALAALASLISAPADAQSLDRLREKRGASIESVLGRLAETSVQVEIDSKNLKPRSLSLRGVTARVRHIKLRDGMTRALVDVSAGNRHAGRLIGEDSPVPWALLQIAEMDKGNGFPEVILSTYSGGAHCCSRTRVLTAGSNGERWKSVDLGWRDGGVLSASDLDLDGRVEFLTSDNRFLYRFSSYAGSVAPLQIHRLAGLRFQDVTREPGFRHILQEHAEQLDRQLPEIRRQRSSANGFLAGYVAAKSLLGEREEAWRIMLELHDRRDDWGLSECIIRAPRGGCLENRNHGTFPVALQAFLESTGY